MSWNLNIVGKTANVKAAVEAEAYVPGPLKDLISFILASGTGPDAYIPQPGAVQVETIGHYDSRGGSYIYSLSVKPVVLALPAPVIEPVVPDVLVSIPPVSDAVASPSN